jgi:hypothetical protein
MTENVFTPHTEPQPDRKPSQRCAATWNCQRCLAEEPQDLRLSGCGIARDCGGALQFVRQEDARTAGQRERAATATDLAGQHRQQRAGVEEPASGRTSERAAGDNGRCCDGRSGACVCDARAAAAAAAYGPTGVAVPCVPGQPCPQLQQGNMQMQLTPVQQQAQLIAAKERERADNSRFASNLVYSRSAEQPQQQQQGQMMPAQYGPAERQANSSLVCPRSRRKTGGHARRL